MAKVAEESVRLREPSIAVMQSVRVTEDDTTSELLTH